MSPIEQQSMCQLAVDANTRQIVAFLRARPDCSPGYLARAIEAEFLGDEIAPVLQLVPVEGPPPPPALWAAEHGWTP